MKKFVWILLVSVFVSPVLAQESSIIRAGAKLAAPSGEMALRVTQQVEKQAALRAAEAVSATRVAQITNWVSKPSIRVQQAANTETSLGSKEQAAAVAARVLDWDAAAQHLFPEGRYGHKAHIPTLFGEQTESALYRGITIRRLDELKELLVKGMTRDRTASYFAGIYAALDAKMALSYATPWGALYPSLPVMVRIPNTPELSAENALEWRSHFDGVFRNDVTPRFISDVMVFLEVNGKPGWYKVVLADEELVFIPAFGTTISW